MKLCKDCKWFKKRLLRRFGTLEPDAKYFTCMNPKTAYAIPVVTDELLYHRSCLELRDQRLNLPCGYEGELWEEVG